MSRNRKNARAAGTPGTQEGGDGPGQTWQSQAGQSTPEARGRKPSDVWKCFLFELGGECFRVGGVGQGQQFEKIAGVPRS